LAAGDRDRLLEHVTRFIVVAGKVPRGTQRHQGAHQRVRGYGRAGLIGARFGQLLLRRLVQSEACVSLAHCSQEVRPDTRFALEAMPDLARSTVENLAHGHGISSVFTRIGQLEQRYHEPRRAVCRHGLRQGSVALMEGKQSGDDEQNAESTNARDGGVLYKLIAARTAP
jgi:hypothetical protein